MHIVFLDESEAFMSKHTEAECFGIPMSFARPWMFSLMNAFPTKKTGHV